MVQNSGGRKKRPYLKSLNIKFSLKRASPVPTNCKLHCISAAAYINLGIYFCTFNKDVEIFFVSLLSRWYKTSEHTVDISLDIPGQLSHISTYRLPQRFYRFAYCSIVWTIKSFNCVFLVPIEYTYRKILRWLG